MRRFKVFRNSVFIACCGLIAGCARTPPELPPLPDLPQNCKFTNKPSIVVPAGQRVAAISVGRRGPEPSLISVGVDVGDEIREDGRIYVPGPDSSFYPYHINHPRYFDSNVSKHVTASMLWSPSGAYYDRGPMFSVLCLSIDGAVITFHTGRTSEPNTIVTIAFARPVQRRAPAAQRRRPQPAIPDQLAPDQPAVVPERQ